MILSQSPVVVVLAAICTTILLGVGFAEAYSLIEPMVSSGWAGAAMLHSFLTIGLFIWWRKQYNRIPLLEQRAELKFFYPALAIVALAILVATSSRLTYGIVHTKPISIQYFFWIFWVPIVEEVVFRGFVGVKFRESFGLIWGTWF